MSWLFRYWHRISAQLDWPIVLILLLIAGTSLATLYSASGRDQAIVFAYVLRLLFGIAVLLVLSQLSITFIARWSPLFFVIGIILLVITLEYGITSKGAKRWLDLGVVRMQPSELIKLLLPMFLAWYYESRLSTRKVAHHALAIITVLASALLVARQPDLGTAILVASAGFLVIFFAGIARRYLISGTILAGCLAPFLWSRLHDYQRSRLLSFLSPENDPLGAGYHTIQSKIAIGSGGFYGKGWLDGSQSQLKFLPEGSTDFIFSTFGEEFGFVGAILLFFAYALLLWRGCRIVWRDNTTYGWLFGSAFMGLFALQILLNIGMVIGALPVVGVPLPIMSYGGSALVTVFAGFGLLLAIKNNRKSFLTN